MFRLRCLLLATLFLGQALSQDNGFQGKTSELEPGLIIIKENGISSEGSGLNENAHPSYADVVYKAKDEEDPASHDRQSTDIAEQHQDTQKQEQGPPSKRFNEFVGKRAVLSLTPNFNPNLDQNNLRGQNWKILIAGTKKTPKSVGGYSLGFETHIPYGNLDRILNANNEVVRKFVNRFYHTLMVRSTPKRQYDFVGKRLDIADNSESPLPQLLQSKRYDFIGKTSSAGDQYKRYDFIGKRYDFIGKRYDFIGKRDLQDTLSKRYDFIGKRGLQDMTKRYDFIGKRYIEDSPDKKYDFIGKKNSGNLQSKRYDFIGKRDIDSDILKRYDFIGKRSTDGAAMKRYDFIGKRGYDFVGKKKREALGTEKEGDEERNGSFSSIKKRSYDFLGKRNVRDSGDGDAQSRNMQEKDDDSKAAYSMENLKGQSWKQVGEKRYSEWIGKKKRSVTHAGPLAPSNRRLISLLKNNKLRKRLSQMLLHRAIPLSNMPQFIGRR